MSSVDLIRRHLTDPQSSWAIGTFGAIAEFHRDPDERDRHESTLAKPRADAHALFARAREHDPEQRERHDRSVVFGGRGQTSQGGRQQQVAPGAGFRHAHGEEK